MTLEYECIAPKESAQSVVIWLHGLGASGHDFVEAVPALGQNFPHTRFIFPHAPAMPVTLNAGMVMPSWYDLYALSQEAKEDQAGIEASAARIQALIAQEHKKGIPYEKIVLMGFSQGGALALYTALSAPYTLAGVAGLSCYLPLRHQLNNYSQQALHLPIFLAHGTQDDIVPFAFGQSCQQHLQQQGFMPEFHRFAMGHQVCLEELALLGQWLKQRI